MIKEAITRENLQLTSIMKEIIEQLKLILIKHQIQSWMDLQENVVITETK